MRSEGKTKNRKSRQKILAMVQVREDSGRVWEFPRWFERSELGVHLLQTHRNVSARNPTRTSLQCLHPIVMGSSNHGLIGQGGSLEDTWTFFFRGSDRSGH